MMNKANFYDVIYTHTEGEPTCIVHSGITYPFGSDILEKRQFLEQEYDWLRVALAREPRGHNDMFGVFVTPPSGPDADASMIWMDGDRFVDMCGHGTIALGMAMVATGLHRSTDHPNTIRFETTAGPVVARRERGRPGVVDLLRERPRVRRRTEHSGRAARDRQVSGGRFVRRQLLRPD